MLGRVPTGETVRIDGVDGFLDADFERRGVGTRFYMIPVPHLEAIPVRTSELDALPVLEVRVVEPHVKQPSVLVMGLATLGSFMRSSMTGHPIPPSAMPVGDLGPELARLIEESSLTRAASWVRSGPKASRGEVRALYVTANETSTRCLLLRTNAVPSQIFEVAPERVE